MKAATLALPVPIEAERALLGAVLVKNGLLATARGLNVEDFGFPSHRRIYRAILALAGDGADIVSVTNHLQQGGELEAVGGAPFVSGLISGIPRLSSVAHYAAIVKDNSERRRVIEGCALVRAIAEAGTGEEAATALERLAGETKGRTSGGVYTARSLAEAEEKDFTRRRDGKERGISTGIGDLDDLLAPGFQRGECWFWGARPSVGKTSALIGVLNHNLTRGRKCVHLALEMGPLRNEWRLLSHRSGVPLWKIRRPSMMEAGELARYSEAWTAMQAEPLVFHDCPAATIEEISWRVKQAREALGGLDLVTLDYFQLVAFGRSETGYEGRTSIAQALAALAVKEQVPVLVGCQLNRGAETDEQKDRPNLADLEGTGRLEQVASGVILLHRWGRKIKATYSPAEIIVAKNQDGACGIVKADYYSLCARWVGENEGREAVDV